MSGKSHVEDYMTKDVISVTPNTSTEDVIKIMKKSNHNSYPVVNNEGKLTGMVTAFDIILKDWVDSVEDLMSTDLVVANEKMSINDASRVMFRKGVSRLPVIDKDGYLKGIITNTDMVRSHIERSTPNKVEVFKKSLENIYGIKTKLRHEPVYTNKIRPTQDKVYADELEGRTYELKRGLAEPAIVVKTGNRWVLVDGHHRTMAAKQLGCEKIDAYIIDLMDDRKIGLEKTADKMGVKTFDDVKILDDVQHPLIAITESIKQSREK
ncbi:CBS domain-containing protein [Methanobrevibacter sp. OttesenSCG-928-K11]|nr:CBS domain-containing protein [Methanobrevibacter sp. OttesenSCG-928-K11]MDL2271367.1 CBS domain-containing protein [Methanobrevibacter sp. OttesenSCG-928-I08]